MTMTNCLALQLYNMTLQIILDPHQLPQLRDKRHVLGVGGCKGEGNVAFQVTPICHYYSQGGSIDWMRTWWASEEDWRLTTGLTSGRWDENKAAESVWFPFQKTSELYSIYFDPRECQIKLFSGPLLGKTFALKYYLWQSVFHISIYSRVRLFPFSPLQVASNIIRLAGNTTSITAKIVKLDLSTISNVCHVNNDCRIKLQSSSKFKKLPDKSQSEQKASHYIICKLAA